MKFLLKNVLFFLTIVLSFSIEAAQHQEKKFQYFTIHTGVFWAQQWALNLNNKLILWFDEEARKQEKLSKEILQNGIKKNIMQILKYDLDVRITNHYNETKNLKNFIANFSVNSADEFSANLNDFLAFVNSPK